MERQTDTAVVVGTEVGATRALPGLRRHASPSRVFASGRQLLGLCFVLDAVWYVASYDVRVAYMDAAGGPHVLLWLTAAVYGVCGLALIADRRARPATLALAVVLVVMTAVLVAGLPPGGIGEYPAELHAEVLFKEIVVHAAILGALLLVAGGVRNADERAMPMASRAGRMLVGGYFVVNALWQWAYFDIRVEHIVASGGNPATLPVFIGLQLVGGTLVAAGKALRIAIPPLMAIIVVSTIVVHGNLSETAPYPPNAQVHQWFVKASILAGLIMVLSGASAARLRPRE